MIERINIKKLHMKYCDYLQIYVPDDYKETTNKYDVIYMHDGHNLFDPKTSAFGMVWGIDKTLKTRKKQYIVVGIECSSMERYHLYSPWKYNYDNKNINQIFAGFGGLGDVYMTWIISTLMPFVSQRYQSRINNSYMAGSSMGGLLSLYVGLTYDKVFKAVGVFSPAIWFAKPELLQFLKKQAKAHTKIYLDIGHEETSNELVSDFPEIYLQDARDVFKQLSSSNTIEILFVEDKTWLHNELYWGRRFSNFLNFIEN